MNNKQREQARLRKQRQRDKERDISGSVTPPSVTEVPAIVTAITNPVMRKKLEAVCSSLKSRNLLGDVRYGCGRDSITFNTVGELLDITA